MHKNTKQQYPVKIMNGMPRGKAGNEYRLYEANDVAKYGIFSFTGNTFSPIEYKTLMYLIWKSIMESQGDFAPLSIQLSEICEALGYGNDKNYNLSHYVRKICEVISGIMSKSIFVYDKEQNEIVGFAWITDVAINLDKETVKIEFSKRLSSFFGVAIKREFTIVRLKYLNRLNSTAAVILYPFFCRYRGIGTFNYDIDELSKLLTGKSGCEYKRLKANHLKPAIEIINDMTDIHVSMSENKRGRKVTSIQFTVYSTPASDELETFMEYNGMRMDEAAAMYDEGWMRHYEYDMGSQRYIRKKV